MGGGAKCINKVLLGSQGSKNGDWTLSNIPLVIKDTNSLGEREGSEIKRIS
jgi:hypothetical protein